jgi:glucose repression mediator protein
MQDLDGAVQCYQQALKCNEWSIPAMQGIACILRTKDHFPQAVEYLRTILKVDQANGEVWGSLGTFPSHIYLFATNVLTSILGHCYLMMDDLQQAYSAYQQALYHLSDPKVRQLSARPLSDAVTNIS